MRIVALKGLAVNLKAAVPVGEVWEMLESGKVGNVDPLDYADRAGGPPPEGIK
jgi:hypothetical protein